jgi:Common central domain of tyrosinase
VGASRLEHPKCGEWHQRDRNSISMSSRCTRPRWPAAALTVRGSLYDKRTLLLRRSRVHVSTAVEMIIDLSGGANHDVLSTGDWTDFILALESRLHNLVHGWVGGDMGIVAVAAFDPKFYSHHCMVDRLWWLWPICNGNGSMPNNLLDTVLAPFNMKVRDVLSVNSLGHDYAAAQAPERVFGRPGVVVLTSLPWSKLRSDRDDRRLLSTICRGGRRFLSTVLSASGLVLSGSVANAVAILSRSILAEVAWA